MHPRHKFVMAPARPDCRRARQACHRSRCLDHWFPSRPHHPSVVFREALFTFQWWVRPRRTAHDRSGVSSSSNSMAGIQGARSISEALARFCGSVLDGKATSLRAAPENRIIVELRGGHVRPPTSCRELPARPRPQPHTPWQAASQCVCVCMYNEWMNEWMNACGWAYSGLCI